MADETQGKIIRLLDALGVEVAALSVGVAALSVEVGALRSDTSALRGETAALRLDNASLRSEMPVSYTHLSVWDRSVSESGNTKIECAVGFGDHSPHSAGRPHGLCCLLYTSHWSFQEIRRHY